MSGSRASSNETDKVGGGTVDVPADQPGSDDSDDESGDEILEESPCGRWVKRREEVRINLYLLLPRIWLEFKRSSIHV